VLKEHTKVEEQGCEIQEEDRMIAQLEFRMTTQDATIDELKSTSEEQKAAIASEQKEIQMLIASLSEQAAQIQKVNAQLQLNRGGSQKLLLDVNELGLKT